MDLATLLFGHRESNSVSKEEKRTRILEAAYGIFKRYGYRKTSMEDIALALGISRPSLYTHFKNKDEIFREVSAALHIDPLEVVAQVLALDRADEPPSTRVFKALLARHQPFLEEVLDSDKGPELQEEYGRLCGDIVTRSNERFEVLLADFLARLVDAGELDLAPFADAPPQAATVLNLSAAGLKKGARTPEAYQLRVRGLVEALFLGLAPG